MMKKITVIVLISFIAFVGCSVDKNPVEPTIPSGVMYRAFVNSPSLEESFLDEPSGRPVFVYEPANYTISSVDSFEVYIDTTLDGVIHYDTTYIYYTVSAADYPVLYLLHGFGFDHTYYSDLFMIKDILDEMIFTGEIDPMVVVTPDCNNTFGGSFYTNSVEVIAGSGLSFDGNFEDFVVTDLMEYMEDNFSVDTLASGRGISGHSMGGYGAMKLAMKYPELFGSVSSMSAPLAFPYFAGWINPMLTENGVDTLDIPEDLSWFYSIEPSATRRVTSMMFAMGAAFSPHDFVYDLDTTYFHRLQDVPILLGIDLPFNYDGVLDTASTVWHRWLEHDPLTMLVAGGFADSLANTDVYIDCGLNDDLGLQLHAQAFSNALTGIGKAHTIELYSGYSGTDAGHTKYIADRIREILKFHDEAFSQAD